jgi:hypothetical protein
MKKWAQVLVTAENKKDMTYSFTFKNQFGQPVWGTKIRPLPGARNFLVGVGLKKNVDYDYTANKITGEYCYQFKNPQNALLFRLWFEKDSPKNRNGKNSHICPNCDYVF